MRQLDGVDIARIERDYNGALRSRMDDLRRRAEILQSQGLLELQGGKLRLAPDRLTVSNDILVELLG